MGDDLEALRKKADGVDTVSMAGDFADVAARLEYTGVKTMEDLREFAERNPETAGKVRSHLKELFGYRRM